MFCVYRILVDSKPSYVSGFQSIIWCLKMVAFQGCLNTNCQSFSPLRRQPLLGQDVNAGFLPTILHSEHYESQKLRVAEGDKGENDCG